jgi:hypothetical protein
MPTDMRCPPAIMSSVAITGLGYTLKIEQPLFEDFNYLPSSTLPFSASSGLVMVSINRSNSQLASFDYCTGRFERWSTLFHLFQLIELEMHW